MKRLLFVLSILSVLSFNSCKKAGDAVTDAANATTEAAGDVANTAGDVATDAANTVTDAATSVADASKNLFTDGYSLPAFNNADMNTWAQNLVTSASDLKNAAAKGDEEAKMTATNKITELSNQLQNFKNDPQFAQATELYNKIRGIIMPGS